MTYSKTQSQLSWTDSRVRKLYIDDDLDGIIALAWHLGFDGDPYFSPYAQDLVDQLGIKQNAWRSYQDGRSDW